MPAALFSVHASVPDRLLSFRVSGFWDLETVTAYRAEMMAVGSSLVQRVDRFDVLADLREFPAQSQEVAEQLQQCVLGGKRMGMRNGVCLYSSALTRIQFARVAASPDFRFTQSAAEAKALLASAPRDSRLLRTA